jgi:hypothetical protein
MVPDDNPFKKKNLRMILPSAADHPYLFAFTILILLGFFSCQFCCTIIYNTHTAHHTPSLVFMFGERAFNQTNMNTSEKI